uniref:Uncharacterized protein n=1 Tax=Serinus canaria TaxID=9135 RepID=A0A8C9NL46_SERCA
RGTFLPCSSWRAARRQEVHSRYSSRQRRMALPAVRRMTPLVNMLASGRAGLSCMVVVERMVSTTPQTSSTRALSSSTRQSEKPPLLRKLSSCFSSTSRARRQSVVPTASRHSPDRLLVLYSRMMPPIPQHRMDFLGSWNHQSSTCSSKIFLWMWSASAGVRGLLSSASSGMVGSWMKRLHVQQSQRFPGKSPYLWPGTLRFCSPCYWSVKHFATGGERRKGSIGSEVLCLAGLPWAQHLVSAHHSWFAGLCPHYPGPP